MTRSRFAFFLASSLLVLPILAGSLLGASVDDGAAAEEGSLYKYLSVFTEVLGLVDQTYVEETRTDALLAAALDGATDALDPLAVYVPESGLSSYLEARSVGSGHSGLHVVRERGMLYALAVDDGSPAEDAGIQEGDLLAEIDGRSTRVLPMWRIQRILAGPPGTELDLKLVRFAENLDASLTLQAFEVPEPNLEIDDGVAVLTLHGIDSATPGRVGSLLEQATGTDRLVLDIRGLAGGDSEAAYRLAGLFAGGELGRLDRQGEPVTTFDAEREPLWSGRLVVLTDGATLGAAEVLAAVLQQKTGAELVGEATFGHASRSTMVELSSGAVVFLADAFYTGPDLAPLDEPLTPDVRVATARRSFEADDEAEEEEGSDAVLEKGLELLAEPAEKAAA
ncbi:MAG: S41 family peptidase [Thermoanaerobaculia bacterium]